jgi:hypothetical protein
MPASKSKQATKQTCIQARNLEKKQASNEAVKQATKQ